MKVYSLSGPSGTGKSTSALQFAYEHEIEAIIDDGLFIVNGEKVAGTSAKFEKNTLKAVRRAIFEEEAHKAEVLQAVHFYEVTSVVIIGTSDKMTRKIAKRLELGEIDHFYYVHQIRSEKEIRMAKYVREIQGKHVMPVPYRQVEQNFFKRLIQRGKEIFSINEVKLGETTIVQPDFHQNNVYITRAVYWNLLDYVLKQHGQLAKFEVGNLLVDGIPRMSIAVYLNAPVHYNAAQELYALQKNISEAFLHHFGIEPEKINIQVKGIRSSDVT